MSDGSSNISGSENQAEELKPQSEDPVCRNCGAPLEGEYCHECGTRRSSELRLRDLGGRFLRSMLDVDDYGAGLWRLFVNGAASPGTLTRQYVKGTRERTVNPIGYFLIASTLAFLVMGLFRAEWVQGQAEMWRAQWAAVGIDSDVIFGDTSPLQTTFGWTSAEEMAQAMFTVLRQAQTYFGVLICLSVAGLLRLVFSEKSYAHLVVFELYTVAQVDLMLLPLVPIMMIWAPAAYSAVGITLWIGIHALAGPGFFGRNWKGWLLPPLAVAVFYVGAGVICGFAAFVWTLLVL